MSYSLNSLKGIIQGNISESIIGVIKGHTRRLNCSSYEDHIMDMIPSYRLLQRHKHVDVLSRTREQSS